MRLRSTCGQSPTQYGGTGLLWNLIEVFLCHCRGRYIPVDALIEDADRCHGCVSSWADYFRSDGTLPPFAASLDMTCFCSHTFIEAESPWSPV